MTKHSLRRDSLGEGSKAGGRSRRNPEKGHADAEKASGRPRRNDILPSLRIEYYSVDALKLHVRKLRKNERAHGLVDLLASQMGVPARPARGGLCHSESDGFAWRSSSLWSPHARAHAASAGRTRFVISAPRSRSMTAMSY